MSQVGILVFQFVRIILLRIMLIKNILDLLSQKSVRKKNGGAAVLVHHVAARDLV